MRAVLDAWAVAALIEGEPPAARVASLIEQRECVISAVNLGEAYYVTLRRHGKEVASHVLGELMQVIDVDEPDWPLARDAAELKARGGLSYPDAFCVATARAHQAPLYTGDDEILALDDVAVELVDLRSAS